MLEFLLIKFFIRISIIQFVTSQETFYNQDFFDMKQPLVIIYNSTSEYNKNEILINNKYDSSEILLNIDWPVNKIVAKLDSFSNKYNFYSAGTNNYFQVSQDGYIILKKKIEKDILKYVNPKIKLFVKAIDKNDPWNELQKEFEFGIETINQQLPAVRLKIEETFKTLREFSRDGAFKIKVGRFEIDQKMYPESRFSLKIIGNITLDDQGNLYLQNNPFNSLNSSTNLIVNIVDKDVNKTVYEDIFDINIPVKITTTTTRFTSTRTTKTTTLISTDNIKYSIECKTDQHCNSIRNGPNKCLLLSEIKYENNKNLLEIEYLIRRFQFVSYKDSTLLLKYNRLFHSLLNPNENEIKKNLAEFNLSLSDLSLIGVCLCDQEYNGFRCKNMVINDKLHQCHPDFAQPSCNPITGICTQSDFLLRNFLKKPSDLINNYRSYYCECNRQVQIGINCEYDYNQCNPGQEYSLIGNDFFTSGSITNNTGRCNSKYEEFCYLSTNIENKFKCLKNQNLTQLVNYLAFEEFGDEFKKENSTKLNLKNPSVLTGIQNFIQNQVMSRYIYKNYVKAPKGPVGILISSVNLPNVLNKVRNKINSFIRLDNVQFSNLAKNRVRQLIRNSLNDLIANQKLNNDVLSNLYLVDDLLARLNLDKVSPNFSSTLWGLSINSFKPSVLESLQLNSDKLTNANNINDILTLSSNSLPYLDLFNFSSQPLNLLKLDILPGIYVESNGELTLRPTPGLFIETIPTNRNRLDKEIIFLPGLFNPVSSSDCSVRSLFTPGLLSYSIDNFDLSNLPIDVNKYLNEFIPIKIPFNINSLLTPLKSSLNDALMTLISNERSSLDKSFMLLTPLELSPDSNIDILNKNDKFMTNLFTADSLHKIVREQKYLKIEDLASTLVLSDPSMLPLNSQNYFNSKCLVASSIPNIIYKPKGVQFYNLTSPTVNVSILPFILYDDDGEPIPEMIVNEALKNYCKSFLDVMNEFHLRLCKAFNQTNTIKEAQIKDPSLCFNCTFIKLADQYYNPFNKNTDSLLWLWILLGALGLLLLLLLLICCCCCCCKFCPLIGFYKRKKQKKSLDSLVITEKSSKYFGDFSRESEYSNNTFLTDLNRTNIHKRKRNSSSLWTIPISTENTINKNMSRANDEFENFNLLKSNRMKFNHQFKRSISFPFLNSANFYRNKLNLNELNLTRSNNFYSKRHINKNSNNEIILNINDNNSLLSSTLQQRQADLFKNSIESLETLTTNLFNYGGINKTFESNNEKELSTKITQTYNDYMCFLCRNKLELIKSNKHYTEIKSHDLMYLCDLCYAECYAHDKKKIYDAELEDDVNHDYTYYVVRSKNGRRNSTGSIIDMININNSNQVPNIIEINLKNCSNNFERNNNVKYESISHSMFKTNKIIVVPVTENDYISLEETDQII